MIPRSEPARRPIWKHPLFRITGSAVMLGLLFWVLPFSEIRAALTSLPVWVFGIAIVIYLMLHLIGIAKWRLVVNTTDAGLPFAGATRAYYWGLFGNTFLPSIVGGDVVRMGMAFRSTHSKAGLVLGSVVDRALDIVGLAAVAGIGALLSPLALDAQSQRILLAVIAVCAAGGLAGILTIWMVPFGRLPFRFRRKLAPLWQALRAARGRYPALVLAFVMSMSLQALLVIMNWELGRLVGIEAPLYVWLFVWPLAKISGLAPVTQGGIGVREAAQAVLFAPFGVSAAKAVAAGLVFEVVIIAGGLLGGGIAWTMGRRGAARG
ncbi:MAG: lysylphosphatidylglycerol synthase transmembrane domain-containing protein [Gemmatimonadaceae bacterium]